MSWLICLALKAFISISVSQYQGAGLQILHSGIFLRELHAIKKELSRLITSRFEAFTNYPGLLKRTTDFHGGHDLSCLKSAHLNSE